MTDLELAERVAELTAQRVRQGWESDLAALQETWRRDLSALRDDLTAKNLITSSACGLECPMKKGLSELSSSQPAKVLVVDDIEAVRKTLVRLLQSAGLLTFSAEDTDAAEEVLKGGPEIDAVILDIAMPKSGYFLLEHIKTFYPTTEVIMTSGYDSNVERARELGAFGFLQKPFTASQAILMIERAVEMRKLKLQVHPGT